MSMRCFFRSLLLSKYGWTLKVDLWVMYHSILFLIYFRIVWHVLMTLNKLTKWSCPKSETKITCLKINTYGVYYLKRNVNLEFMMKKDKI